MLHFSVTCDYARGPGTLTFLTGTQGHKPDKQYKARAHLRLLSTRRRAALHLRQSGAVALQQVAS